MKTLPVHRKTSPVGVKGALQTIHIYNSFLSVPVVSGGTSMTPLTLGLLSGLGLLAFVIAGLLFWYILHRWSMKQLQQQHRLSRFPGNINQTPNYQREFHNTPRYPEVIYPRNVYHPASYPRTINYWRYRYQGYSYQKNLNRPIGYPQKLYRPTSSPWMLNQPIHYSRNAYLPNSHPRTLPTHRLPNVYTNALAIQ